MIRLFLILLAAVPLILFGIWVDVYISMVEFTVLDKFVQIHPLLLLTIIILFYIALYIILSIIAVFLNLPSKLAKLFSSKKIQNAEALNNLILAVKNLDLKAAEIHLKRVKASYVSPIICDLMQGKIYELRGEIENSIKTYSKYIDNDKISSYALFKVAKNSMWLGKTETAFENFKILVERTQSKEILRFFIINGLKLDKYNEVIEALEDRGAYEAFGKDKINRILSYVYSQQAVASYHKNIYNDAFELSSIANKIRPDFIGVEMEILSAIKLNEVKASMKLLAKYYDLIDDIKLYTLIGVIGRNEDTKKVYSFFKGIADSGHKKSLVLAAKSALDAGEFDEASAYISEAIDNEMAVAYLLMAEYCLRTHGNASEAFMWFERFSTQIDYITFTEFKQVQQEVYSILYNRDSEIS